MPTHRSLLALVATLHFGCGASGDATPKLADAGGTSDAPSPVDAGAPADAATPTGEASAPSCVGACATLTGNVKRVALTKPQNGGKGDVYVAVFDHDPVTDKASAALVGEAVVANVDFTSDTAEAPYSIGTIPPRADPYYVVAFLDDAHAVTGASPSPAKGDLVSLDGIASPTVTVATTAPVSFDISLNAVMPF